MDEFDVSKIPTPQHNDKPIPFDDSGKGDVDVSHTPLTLGGSAAQETAKPKSASRPQPSSAAGPSSKAPAVSQDRITGVKTFFTKLHVGAIEFLDGQIAGWLKANPGIKIKRTNTATGDVVGKKTEPNIIVTIWY